MQILFGFVVTEACAEKVKCDFSIYTLQDFWILSAQLRAHTKVVMVAKADFCLPDSQQTVNFFINI